MIGTVRKISKTNGFFTVETPGGLTVIEPLDEVELEIGDVIRGDLESHGNETLKIQGREEFEGLIQAVHASAAHAEKLLRGE
jgi:hypothetical protein